MTRGALGTHRTASVRRRPGLSRAFEEAVGVLSGSASPDESDLRNRVDEVTAALEDLRAVLSQEDQLPVVLNRMCRQAALAIPGADMASVSLLNDGEPTTVAVTDEHAMEIDKAQYRAEEGPCLHAAATGEMVRITVSELDGRWPAFAAAAG